MNKLSKSIRKNLKSSMRSKFSVCRFISTFVLTVFIQLVSFGQEAKEQTWIAYDSTIYTATGYLVYFGNFLMFLETSEISTKIDFEKLSAIKGQIVRGTLPDFFVNGRDSGRKVKVKELLKNPRTNEMRVVPVTYTITPVKLRYYLTDKTKMEEGALSILFKRKKYTINYVDNWDIAITGLDVLK